MPTNVEEFLTKEERDERYRVLRSKENPPRGLVKFSESVDAENFVGPPPPEVCVKFRSRDGRFKRRLFPMLRKLQFRKRAHGHSVWYVAWSA